MNPAALIAEFQSLLSQHEEQVREEMYWRRKNPRAREVAAARISEIRDQITERYRFALRHVPSETQDREEVRFAVEDRG